MKRENSTLLRLYGSDYMAQQPDAEALNRSNHESGLYTSSAQQSGQGSGRLSMKQRQTLKRQQYIYNVHSRDHKQSEYVKI